MQSIPKRRRAVRYSCRQHGGACSRRARSRAGVASAGMRRSGLRRRSSYKEPSAGGAHEKCGQNYCLKAGVMQWWCGCSVLGGRERGGVSSLLPRTQVSLSCRRRSARTRRLERDGRVSGGGEHERGGTSQPRSTLQRRRPPGPRAALAQRSKSATSHQLQPAAGGRAGCLQLQLPLVSRL